MGRRGGHVPRFVALPNAQSALAIRDSDLQPLEGKGVFSICYDAHASLAAYGSEGIPEAVC